MSRHQESLFQDEDDSYAGDEPSLGASYHSASRSSNSKSKGSSEQLSTKQSQAVLRLRLLVLLLLMVCAMAVSISVFAVAITDVAHQFEHEYGEAASALIRAFGTDVMEDVGAISSLATSHQRPSNWPFETVPNFVQLARRARHGTGILSVSIAPLVNEDQFNEWDNFVMDDANTYWMDEGLAYQEQKGIHAFEHPDKIEQSKLIQSRKIDPMHQLNESGHAIEEQNTSPFYLPVFQMDPVLQTGSINENLLLQTQTNTSLPPEVALIVLEEQRALLGDFVSAPPGNFQDPNPSTALFATLLSMAKEEEVAYLGDPNAHFFVPVFDGSNNESSAVAVLTATVNWRTYFEGKVSENMKGITLVLSNHCYDNASSDNNSYTYEVRGSDVHVVGFGDHHDEMLDGYRITGSFSQDTLDDGSVSGVRLLQSCQYQLDIYPTEALVGSYKTGTPIGITLGTVFAFICIIFLFLFYDRMVEARQQYVLANATQSAALVSSLFPKAVGDRLMKASVSPNHSLLMQQRITNKQDDTPIADLYMNCTVCFMDIAGFTAWSSTREPTQVFVLLQAIYSAFDDLAKRRRVFKVETIGDSYMAVTGLPDPMKNHAPVMVRFASECLIKMRQVVKDLEGSLGPDTGGLSMRVGLNSGPVTAGVIRGQRSRYQLFGDTVNTASRMETTGRSGRIQVSFTTADLLRKAGKGHWVKAREDQILAKGKGVLSTFWAHPYSSKSESSGSSLDNSADRLDAGNTKFSKSKPASANEKLVEWVVTMMVDDIKKIVSCRNKSTPSTKVASSCAFDCLDGAIPMDEVRETIELQTHSIVNTLHSGVVVSDAIIGDLTQYVQEIASRYRDNPFHSFQHACHVTMSVKKLLSRIVAPDNLAPEEQHEMTYGIISDPLAALAMTFSALIHDVDHNGVSNTQLGKEQPELAKKYRRKSIAEQNSFDIAWGILMDDRYESLRAYIFHTQEEMMRFRQLVVNIVLATDIFDEELNNLRKARWTKAFSGDPLLSSELSSISNTNKMSLRATIVVEHLMQASDVSHTMQHWQVYQKWNKRLFMEMHRAYEAGRLAKDPGAFWYQGELGFFDNYIIPLAKKMKDCGVFGISSDEYLSYALKNRSEWEARGRTIVEDFTKEAQKSF